MDDQPESDRDWSSLPEGILSLVLQGLNDTNSDCRRLRAVCTSWRSSLSPPPRFPLSVSIPLPKDNYRHPFFIYDKNPAFVEQSIFYLISPPTRLESSRKASVWLIRVQEWPDKHKWTLHNPICRAHRYIPMPKHKAQVNLLDYKISEVARSYNLNGSVDKELKALKTVMIPSLQSGFTAENYCVLALVSRYNLSMFNSETKNWDRITKDRFLFTDIIAYEEKFYVTTLWGKLLVINPMTLEMKMIIKSTHIMVENSEELFTYLVESCGKLYLVYKVTNAGILYFSRSGSVSGDSERGKPLDLEVFVLDFCFENGEKKYFWEPVTNIGDRVFFVSEYVTFTMTAQELGWDKGNCIIFTQDGFVDRAKKDDPEICYDIDSDYYASELQMFSRYCGIYTLEDCKIVTTPSAHQQIFWPIPTWLASSN